MKPSRPAAPQMGKDDIGLLLWKLSAPAAVGMMVMSLNNVVDTIFIGHWLGTLGIAGVSVVVPVTFLIAIIGMALGVGGSSISARALGAGQPARAEKALANLLLVNLALASLASLLALAFERPILLAFGAQGAIYPFAAEYYRVSLYGLPLFSTAMFFNNMIRSQGQARVSMRAMMLAAVLNIVLDPILIRTFGMGMAGAAWASNLSYLGSVSFSLNFFLRGPSRVRFRRAAFRPDWGIVGEAMALGSTNFARQGTNSLLTLVVNQALFTYGGEVGVAVYGIVNRVVMFTMFPLTGLAQGFLPVAGFNYGARHFGRVRETLALAARYGMLAGLLALLVVELFPRALASAFTDDPELVDMASHALRMVFLTMPLVGLQFLGAGYFQAIGQAGRALFLALSRQGLLLVPLVLVLPRFWQIDGVWYSFVIADALAFAITAAFVVPQWKRLELAQSRHAEEAEAMPQASVAPSPS